jgi:hypothetical protein
MTAQSKLYMGRRTSDGVSAVSILTASSRGDVKQRPLRHVKVHSQKGLQWGTAGSEAADTALSILADHFGERISRATSKTDDGWASSKALIFHQAFKRDVVATLPKESFRLSTEQIDAWLAPKRELSVWEGWALNWGDDDPSFGSPDDAAPAAEDDTSGAAARDPSAAAANDASTEDGAVAEEGEANA